MWTSLYQPTSIPKTILYTVQSEDNLWVIARRFNISALHIIEVNPQLNPFTLSPGQIIHIPKG